MPRDLKYSPLMSFILPLAARHFDFSLFFGLLNWFNILASIFVYKSSFGFTSVTTCVASMSPFWQCIHCEGSCHMSPCVSSVVACLDIGKPHGHEPFEWSWYQFIRPRPHHPTPKFSSFDVAWCWIYITISMTFQSPHYHRCITNCSRLLILPLSKANCHWNSLKNACHSRQKIAWSQWSYDFLIVHHYHLVASDLVASAK